MHCLVTIDDGDGSRIHELKRFRIEVDGFKKHFVFETQNS